MYGHPVLLDSRENKLSVQIENDILKQLSTLEREFKRYFQGIIPEFFSIRKQNGCSF